MKLFTEENNPATLKVLLAAKYGDKHVDINMIRVSDECILEPRRLPYLVAAEEDKPLFMVNTAMTYLWPPAKEIVEEVTEWLEWESTSLAPALAFVIGSGSKIKYLKDNLIQSLNKLNSRLKERSYVIHSSICVCDISLWSLLFPLYKDESLCNEYLTENGNIINWFQKLETEEENIKRTLELYPIAAGHLAYQVLLNSSKYLMDPFIERSNDPANQINTEEITVAKNAWQKNIDYSTKLEMAEGVLLPEAGKKNILITSALPYVNNVPHLGNIIGCVLSADVFARFSRLCEQRTLFICGTDEYGTATETKALEEGITCQEICDKYFKIHDEIYKWFNISFDHFGRTSTPEQTEICQDIFLQMNSNGFMFTDAVEQLHCENCDRFLADRFVEGGCPHMGCTYEDARGDQCDGCGKLVNAVDLKNPRCKICKSTPKLKISKQFFMDLPKLEPLLHHWLKISSPGWTHNAQEIAKAWLKEGLKPRCITRDLKWGIPVPLDGYRDKVFYVWFDAPIGYMSITKLYTKNWEKWWKPDEDTNITLYHFMAKDNVPFHSIMFPATLLGCNRGYTTVSHIMATEYLNYEDGKFSKSRGNGVFGTDAQDTGIPSDIWRFYLLFVRPESQDSNFSWIDLATKNNSELLNNLGNFINRSLVFAKNNFNKTIPKLNLNDMDYTFLALCTTELKSYVKSLQKAKLRDGIRHILAISKHGNQYMQSNQPWVLLKGSDEDKVRAGTVIGVSCNIVCLLAILLSPYMPDTSAVIKKQLNCKDYSLSPDNIEIVPLLNEGHVLGEPSPIFTKIEVDVINELKAKFTGKQDGVDGKGTVENSIQNMLPSTDEQVQKQAEIVRKLKASGADKSVWQPEVQKLLALKANLQQTPKSDTKAAEEEITKQALVVRKLKEGGAEKSVWQPEVDKLLALKSKLASINGIAVAPQKGKKGKK